MQTVLERPETSGVTAAPPLADLRQKLLEREARLREMELAEGTALSLLQGQVSALQEAEETHLRALQASESALSNAREQADLLAARLRHALQDGADHQARAAALLASFSWRVTRPLRAIRAIFRFPGFGG
jgi:hypothetical protein